MTVVATMNEETVIQVKSFRTRELATLIRYEGKKKTIYQNKNSLPRNFTDQGCKPAMVNTKKTHVQRGFKWYFERSIIYSPTTSNSTSVLLPFPKSIEALYVPNSFTSSRI